MLTDSFGLLGADGRPGFKNPDAFLLVERACGAKNNLIAARNRIECVASVEMQLGANSIRQSDPPGFVDGEVASHAPSADCAKDNASRTVLDKRRDQSTARAREHAPPTWI